MNAGRKLGFVSGALVVAAWAALNMPYAVAGTVSGQAVTETADYRFSACEKPVVPAFEGGDAQSHNDAVFQYNQYIEIINSYMTCITEEANADIAAQIAVITRAHQTEMDRVKAESAAGKARLEVLRENEN